MPDNITTLLLIAGVTVLCILQWTVSVALVYWDVTRRGLPGRQQFAWLALAALLPLAGVAIYLSTRAFDLLFPQQAPTGDGRPPRRFTALKPPLEPAGEPVRRLPTMAVEDLGRQTRLSPLKARPPSLGIKRAGPLFMLTILEGPAAGRKFPVSLLPARIGRGPGSTVHLNEDLGVSRQHAEIYHQGGVLRIRDLNSNHGTFVNGASIIDEIVRHGDKIKVGLSILLLTVEEVK